MTDSMMLPERLRQIARYTEVPLSDDNRRALNEAADLIERLSRTPTADDVERVARSICWHENRQIALQCDVNENETPDFDDCTDEGKEAWRAVARAALAAMPPADEAIVGRLREALMKCRAVLGEIPAPVSYGLWSRMCNAMVDADGAISTFRSVSESAADPSLSSELRKHAGADHAPGSAARNGSAASLPDTSATEKGE